MKKPGTSTSESGAPSRVSNERSDQISECAGAEGVVEVVGVGAEVYADSAEVGAGYLFDSFADGCRDG